MAWDSVDSSKATEKQIKYAETLLEACYGDINKPIYTMSKQDISVLIEETKKKLNEKGINYHNSITEVPIGTEVEGRLMPYVETAVRGSIPAHEHVPGSAIETLRSAEREAMRRSGENLLRRERLERSIYRAIQYGTRPLNPFYGIVEIEALRGEE